MSNKSKPGWFSFSIRDLLWLTFIVALGLGWWIDRGRVAADRDELEKMVAVQKEWLDYQPKYKTIGNQANQP